MTDKTTGAKEPRDRPSDLDGQGYSDESYRPGYPTKGSLGEASETDLKRGYTEGG